MTQNIAPRIVERVDLVLRVCAESSHLYVYLACESLNVFSVGLIIALSRSFGTKARRLPTYFVCTA